MMKSGRDSSWPLLIRFGWREREREDQGRVDRDAQGEALFCLSFSKLRWFKKNFMNESIPTGNKRMVLGASVK